jgi:hypothetical protein
MNSFFNRPGKPCIFKILYNFAKNISEKPCNHSGLFMEAQCIITLPGSLLWYCGTFGLAPSQGVELLPKKSKKTREQARKKFQSDWLSSD